MGAALSSDGEFRPFGVLLLSPFALWIAVLVGLFKSLHTGGRYFENKNGSVDTSGGMCRMLLEYVSATHPRGHMYDIRRKLCYYRYHRSNTWASNAAHNTTLLRLHIRTHGPWSLSDTFKYQGTGSMVLSSMFTYQDTWSLSDTFTYQAQGPWYYLIRLHTRAQGPWDIF